MLNGDGLPRSRSHAKAGGVRRFGAIAGFSGWIPRCSRTPTAQKAKRDRGLKLLPFLEYPSACQICRQFLRR